MSITTAINRAYQLKIERNWTDIYWAIDLHGVCLKSNYTVNSYEFINEDVVKTLLLIQSLPESKIIIWSSCYKPEQLRIKKFFKKHGVVIDFFNKNTDVKNTTTGCFDEKFYFNILLDDKAGFDPETDWKIIYKYLKNNKL
jgi:hypothetical protein